MRRWAIPAVIVAALLVAAAAWGLSSLLQGPPGTIAQYGYIKSLTPSGKSYVLKLDPALWLEGTTARMAAKEDGQEAFDYYIRNPEHRLLVYKVPAGIPVTVVTVRRGPVTSMRIPVAELAQIVKGKNPKHRPLIERGSGRHLGYWVRTHIDTVTSIDQQYQP